jgi:hypothetical protein
METWMRVNKIYELAAKIGPALDLTWDEIDRNFMRIDRWAKQIQEESEKLSGPGCPICELSKEIQEEVETCAVLDFTGRMRTLALQIILKTQEEQPQ